MLTAKILNSAASLNNFKEIASLEFILGEELNLVFRLQDPQFNLRHVPPVTAIVKVTFNNIDGTTLEKTATEVDSGDRSMQTVNLTELETENILGGNISFQVDVLGDGTEIIKGIIYNALSKIILDC
jgi:hypothetical protein